jgi:recombinational DNA repair protein RecT
MNGFKKQLFSPIERIEAHAKKYSRGYRYDLETGKKSSPWSTNFDAMAKKTMIRQLIGKWGIMSVEMQQAYANDMGVIDEDGSVRYVDNPQTVPVEVRVQEDIAKNANAEVFEDNMDDLSKTEKSSVKEGAAKADETAGGSVEADTPQTSEPEVKQEPAKRGRPKKTEAKEETKEEKAVIDIPDNDGMEDWMID